MRTIAALSAARSDYGILRPILRAIADTPRLRLQLIVGDAHVVAGSIADIDRDGFTIDDRVPLMPSSDAAPDIARALGRATIEVTAALERGQPDILLLIGDRFETFGAAAAAAALAIPIAHVHGGELSAGAIDEQLRHAITKLSHVHFVCTERHAARVVQMGEEPWRVHVTGAPSLDNLRSMTFRPVDTLEAQLGIPLRPAPLLVTFHPVTLEAEAAASQVEELVAALDAIDHPLVITAPNVDTANLTIRRALERFAAGRPNAVFVEHLGTDAYFSMMAISAAIVGNSSSALLEAASFRLPAVNIGRRQADRDRPPNVIDVECDRQRIREGIAKALDPAFRDRLPQVNPHGDGRAAERIVRVLAEVPLNDALRMKRFHELQVVS
jgi:UDP-hydrolysing UDP-N-acetyl-D-glucosamine 2-epimerase